MQTDRPIPNKPFSLYPYNKAKLPPLPPIKRVDIYVRPEPVRYTVATTLRHRAAEKKRENGARKEPDYSELAAKTLIDASKPPSIIPKQTNTYRFRYKIGRDVPTVPCRFIEHVMLYRKPPFTNPRKNRLARFKFRNMAIKNVKKSKNDTISEPFS